jgi:hypothetical protein
LTVFCLAADDLHGRSISSLSVYPDRAKGFLLVLALPSLVDAPSSQATSPFSLGQEGGGDHYHASGSGKVLTTALLKLYDLGTYRAQHTFPGIVIHSTFCRAVFSADGRYVTCGTIIRNHEGVESNHVRVWDTLTGRHQDSKIASLPHPFIPRSISWHPKQHVMAVAMVGHGAAVGVYCANKARNEDVVHDFSVPPGGEAVGNDSKGFTSAPEVSISPTVLSSPGRLRKFKRATRKGGGAGDGVAEDSDAEVPEVRTKEQRAARTREILDKIRAAKARARGENNNM